MILKNGYLHSFHPNTSGNYKWSRHLTFDGGKIWKMTFKLFRAKCELSYAQKIFFLHYEVYLTNNCSSDN